ncbi:MAG: hypothetical protein N2Z21_10100 [Candidatus Sumerlaeaceae bacterium]|nr:hypothetical protein [Candidatus Sumerlaeaceae bacterium]
MLALVGLYLFLMKGRHTWPVELVGWGSLGFMASVVYVSKGGTMDYIFTIGEPAMAAFAALAVTSIVGWKRQEEESEGTKPHGPSTIPLLRLFIAIAATTVVCGPGIGFIWRTLKQETYELDEYRTRQVVELIRQHTGENDEILAPPFYAFLAKRRIICDYSEIFLWTLKYYNERQDKVRGAGVVTVERIANALREKKVKFVALDLDQTGKIPEIREAIANTYEQLRQSEFRTLNTRLMFFIPRDRSQAE